MGWRDDRSLPPHPPPKRRRAVSALVRQMQWERLTGYPLGPAEKMLRLRMLDAVAGRHHEMLAAGSSVLAGLLAKSMGAAGRTLYGGVIGMWMYNVMAIQSHPDPAYRYIQEVARVPSLLGHINRDILARGYTVPAKREPLTPRTMLSKVMTPAFLSFRTLEEREDESGEGSIYTMSLHIRSATFGLGVNPSKLILYLEDRRSITMELLLVHQSRELITNETRGLPWLWWQLYMWQNRHALEEIGRRSGF